MKKTIKVTSRFKKDLKRVKKQKKNISLIKDIIGKLEHGENVPQKYFPHRLKGNWIHHFECHLEPDWLLIWRDKDEVITLVRTGSHSELFQK